MTAGPAIWLQPALLATLALRVAAGEADAPWLVLGALIAPLVALLAPARRPPAPGPVTATAAAAAVVALLAVNFLLAADTATLLGGAPWQGVILAAALAVLAPLSPARRLGASALVLGLVALVLPLGAVALVTATAPWTAWSRGGLRPALTFAPGSAWVHDGERFPRPARLTFAEGQRVTALTAGVYRVVERDAAPPTVRDWRLASGETLTLRPGDELSVGAGARLRFEAGRRVPGAPASGVAWADAPARGPGMLPAALGGLITLGGGALALVPGVARRGSPAVPAPVLLLAGIIAAAGWGVYAAAAASDMTLSGSLPVPWLRLPPLALGPRTGAPLATVAVAGMGLLLVSATVALRWRLAAAARPEPTLWVTAVVVAAALTAWPVDPWRLLTLGLGLAAALWMPSLLATSRAGGATGSIVGGAVFVALAAVPALAPIPSSPTWLEVLTRYPALVALPLGWAAARAVDGAAGDEPRRSPHGGSGA
ncbi:MAG TPA: hypothetical protein VFV05_06760 [Methylomirabilota bacterium]|nr:hypothetical protein [Methylomirabilota bacterium]